jgi:hypothetical protein
LKLPKEDQVTTPKLEARKIAKSRRKGRIQDTEIAGILSQTIIDNEIAGIVSQTIIGTEIAGMVSQTSIGIAIASMVSPLDETNTDTAIAEMVSPSLGLFNSKILKSINLGALPPVCIKIRRSTTRDDRYVIQ